MQATILPLYTPTTPSLDQKAKTIFLKVMLHIKLKRKKSRTLCTFDRSLGHGKKVYHWKCADKYILIELNEMVGFGYDLWTYMLEK